uniref:Reverse transcriptase domain-containing protein n=1 Tax=Macrostomum lignano TaxID=282301 RepID=A0A1I8JA32_9PLAT
AGPAAGPAAGAAAGPVAGPVAALRKRWPLLTAAWTPVLLGDSDAEFLIAGIRDGFRITDAAPTSESQLENHASARCEANRNAVELQIREEVVAGRYISATDLGIARPTIISPLGAVPKADGAIRLIHDASAPQGNSLNDLYKPRQKMKFANVEDLTRQLAPSWFISKVDLRHAYRSVQVHPDCYKATGLRWTFELDGQPTYLVDTRLPFGAAASVNIFHRLTQAVKRFMYRQFSHLSKFVVIAYLDDFCIAARDYEVCLQLHNFLLVTLQRLGFEINWAKTQSPATSVTFLGVQIDTLTGLLSLPAEKMDGLRELLQDCANSKSLQKRRLQHLVGKLNWFCKVAKPAKALLRALLEITIAIPEQHHRVPVRGELLAQLQFWQHAIPVFPTDKLWRRARVLAAVETDACVSAGGMILSTSDGQREFRLVDFCSDAGGIFLSEHINAKETVLPLLAIILFQEQLAGGKVACYVDSSAAVGTINRGASSNPIVMTLLKTATLAALRHDFQFRAHHMPGSWQLLSDPLSRCLTHPRHMLLFLLRYFGRAKAQPEDLRRACLNESTAARLLEQASLALSPGLWRSSRAERVATAEADPELRFPYVEYHGHWQRNCNLHSVFVNLTFVLVLSKDTFGHDKRLALNESIVDQMQTKYVWFSIIRSSAPKNAGRSYVCQFGW